MLPILSLPHHPAPGELTAGYPKNKLLAPAYRIYPEARNRHCHIMGRSGVGKSRLLELFLYQDTKNGLGGCCIDPHSELIESTLRSLITGGVLDDQSLREKLIYIEPTRKDYVIPLNLLATPDEPYMVASAVIEAFRRTWSSLGEAPNFTNIMRNSLLLLIETKQTLIDFPRLFEDTDWRDQLIEQAGNRDIAAFWHNRYDKWGREAHLRAESSLNKVTEYILNPYIAASLGQRDTLDLREIMDSGKILWIDMGRLDPETRRLFGSLIVTQIEIIMRKRESRGLWPLTIDEFAQYMASEGAATTMAHFLSEARKFEVPLTAANQTLSQLTAQVLGALANVDNRFVFSVGRYDAEWLAKVIGCIDTDAIKQAATDDIRDQYDPLPEQWEKWIQSLMAQPPRHAWVVSQGRPAQQIITLKIPQYTATDEQVEQLKQESLARYGLPYHRAQQNLRRDLSGASDLSPTPLFGN